MQRYSAIGSCLWKAALFCLLLPLAAGAESTVRVGGNGTGLEVIKALLPAFAKEHPAIKVQVMKSLGSSGGIKALNAGALDLSLSSRPLKEEEQKLGAVQVFAARTPYIFFANNSVAKTGLTAKEVEDIYGGKMTKWADGSQIKLVLRPEGDTDTRTVKDLSPAIARAVNDALHRPGMLTALTDEDSDQYIGRIPGAVGGSSLAQVATGKLSGRVLSYNGVKPSLESLADGSYPIAKEILLIENRSRPSRDVEALVAFVRSPKGAALLRALGVAVDKKHGR